MPQWCYCSMEKHHSFEFGNAAIRCCAWIYGIYAFFLLVECIGFLGFLHTPTAGQHATYTLVHVAFFIVELILCASLTLGLLILQVSKEKSVLTVVFTILAITLIRSALIYYIYCQTEPNGHFVPYIYKEANGLSTLMRVIFLPLQIITGLGCAWIWIKQSLDSKHKN